MLVLTSAIAIVPSAAAGRCNYPDDLDAAGHRCGGRAASERPGGYEPPAQNPQSSSPERLQNTPTEVTQLSTAFTGFCKVDQGANLRSNHTLTNNVIENTGDAWRMAHVYTVENHDNALWAYTTVAFGNSHQTNAWVHGSQLYDCHL